jgi:hypothetical protein
MLDIGQLPRSGLREGLLVRRVFRDRWKHQIVSHSKEEWVRTGSHPGNRIVLVAIQARTDRVVPQREREAPTPLPERVQFSLQSARVRRLVRAHHHESGDRERAALQGAHREDRNAYRPIHNRKLVQYCSSFTSQMSSLKSLAFTLCSAIRRSRCLSRVAFQCFPEKTMTSGVNRLMSKPAADSSSQRYTVNFSYQQFTASPASGLPSG